MKKHLFPLMLSVVLLPDVAMSAEEIKIAAESRKNLFLNVYQNNSALVQADYMLTLPEGVVKANFEGVAKQIQPQTALIGGTGLKVLEKNYEYNVLNQETLLNAYVGKEVKTVRENPETGAEIFAQAKVLSAEYNSPVLEFDYGIDPQFNGRVVFDKVPENLHTKPTLSATIENQGITPKKLSLNYLCGGMSWSGNYAAEIVDDAKLNLQAWVQINNQSGTDFKNANVSLTAGKVKNVNAYNNGMARPMLAMARTKAAYAETDAVAVEEAGIGAQSFGAYYTYQLPEKIDLLDKQSKQISLWRLEGVSYQQEYKFTSPLSEYSQGFERQHADIVYHLTNNTEANLGRPMPSGTVRFYEKDSNGNQGFIGSADLTALAVGEKAKLNVGESYDIYASGKVVRVNKIASKTNEIEYEVVLHNSGKNAAEVVWEQRVNGNAEVLSESAKSEAVEANLLRWRLLLPAGEKIVLTYKLRLTRN